MALQVKLSNGALPTMRRNDVKQGQLFSHTKRDGTMSQKLLLAIGKNGKNYSINLENKAIASSTNDAGGVVIRGYAEWVVSRFNLDKEVPKTRGEVLSGEMFTLDDDDKRAVYLHIGELADKKLLSVPFDNFENHAITANRKSHVRVIGTFSIKANVVAKK